MPGGGLQIQAASRLLPVPYVRANLPDCHHVLDLLLDQARGRPGARYPRGDQPADPVDPARQQPKKPAARLLH